MAFLLRDRFRNAIAGSSINEATTSSPPSEPPTFEIDLSLPPEQRYNELSAALGIQLKDLRLLLDDLGAQILSPIPASWLHFLCWLFLRNVYDAEQTRELRGISAVTGVSLYLLVLFNNILDLLMGCSSGGARISEDRAPGGSKMVHFRAMDWEMAILRKLVVQLHFRESRNGPIVASSIGYAGHVGILTGVRPGLSLSQNFRSSRNSSGHILTDIAYFWHVFMVLLGQRPSIAGILRTFLLRHNDSSGQPCPPTRYSDVVYRMPSMTTPSSYLCFCNGQETTIFEKDHTSARMRRSNEFIAVTNNDTTSLPYSLLFPAKGGSTSAMSGPDDFLQDSALRRHCVEKNWDDIRATPDVSIADIVTLVQKYPTTNKKTHFACVMDPENGVIYWSRCFEKAIGEEWIRAHG